MSYGPNTMVKLGTAVQVWQTPATDRFRSRGGDRKDEMGLDQQARHWATPRKEGFDAGRHRGEADSLHSQVKQWPTPTTQDGENDGGPSQEGRHSPPLNLMAKWPTPAAQTGEGGPHGLDGGSGSRKMLGENKPQGQLSAAWVTQLMGFPDGWIQVEPEPKPRRKKDK